MRQGKGLFRRPDGFAYEGQWAADAQHGQGQCRFENGDKCAICLLYVSGALHP
jgi:hypothetical protein